MRLLFLGSLRELRSQREPMRCGSKPMQLRTKGGVLSLRLGHEGHRIFHERAGLGLAC